MADGDNKNFSWKEISGWIVVGVILLALEAHALMKGDWIVFFNDLKIVAGELGHLFGAFILWEVGCLIVWVFKKVTRWDERRSRAAMSANIVIKCPDCQTELDVPREYVGRRAECPECGHKFEIPLPITVREGRKTPEKRPFYSFNLFRPRVAAFFAFAIALRAFTWWSGIYNAKCDADMAAKSRGNAPVVEVGNGVSVRTTSSDSPRSVHQEPRSAVTSKSLIRELSIEEVSKLEGRGRVKDMVLSGTVYNGNANVSLVEVLFSLEQRDGDQTINRNYNCHVDVPPMETRQFSVPVMGFENSFGTCTIASAKGVGVAGVYHNQERIPKKVNGVSGDNNSDYKTAPSPQPVAPKKKFDLNTLTDEQLAEFVRLSRERDKRINLVKESKIKSFFGLPLDLPLFTPPKEHRRHNSNCFTTTADFIGHIWLIYYTTVPYYEMVDFVSAKCMMPPNWDEAKCMPEVTKIVQRLEQLYGIAFEGYMVNTPKGNIKRWMYRYECAHGLHSMRVSLDNTITDDQTNYWIVIETMTVVKDERKNRDAQGNTKTTNEVRTEVAQKTSDEDLAELLDLDDKAKAKKSPAESSTPQPPPAVAQKEDDWPSPATGNLMAAFVDYAKSMKSAGDAEAERAAKSALDREVDRIEKDDSPLPTEGDIDSLIDGRLQPLLAGRVKMRMRRVLANVREAREVNALKGSVGKLNAKFNAAMEHLQKARMNYADREWKNSYDFYKVAEVELQKADASEELVTECRGRIAELERRHPDEIRRARSR